MTFHDISWPQIPWYMSVGASPKTTWWHGHTPDSGIKPRRVRVPLPNHLAIQYRLTITQTVKWCGLLATGQNVENKCVPGVGHHGYINTAKCFSLYEVNFSPSTLLRRCTKHNQLQTETVPSINICNINYIIVPWYKNQVFVVHKWVLSKFVAGLCINHGLI